MLNLILWLPKQILLSHYVVLVHLTTPRSRLDQADAKCDRMRQRLFGKAR